MARISGVVRICLNRIFGGSALKIFMASRKLTKAKKKSSVNKKKKIERQKCEDARKIITFLFTISSINIVKIKINKKSKNKYRHGAGNLGKSFHRSRKGWFQKKLKS